MHTVIIFLAQYLYIIILVIAGIVFLTLGKKAKIEFLVLAIVSGLIALLLSKLSAHFIYSTRPFVLQDIKPLFPHAPDNGFPSDHTVLSTVVALVVYLRNKKIGYLLFILAIAVGTARVIANVHHPIDIIGGIVIAFLSVYIGFYLTKKIVGKN